MLQDGMLEISAPELLTLPYAERQRIVVDDERVHVALQAEPEDEEDDDERSFLRSVSHAPGKASEFVANKVKKLRSLSQDAGVRIVTRAGAVGLTFPPGHYLDDVLYIGHPGIPGRYYPAAQFHSTMAQDKFAEAIRLLMALGAEKVEVSNLEDRSRNFTVDLASPVRLRKSQVAVQIGEGKGLKEVLRDFDGQSHPTHAPYVPEDLHWFQDEPMWLTLAEGRLRHGLQRFDLTVQYTDDFGINSDLVGKVSKIGVKLGGKWEDSYRASWHFAAEFAPLA